MSSSALQLDRLQALGYVGPRQRSDCCGGCRHSTAVRYERCNGPSLICAATKGIVSAGGICGRWAPKVEVRVAA